MAVLIQRALKKPLAQCEKEIDEMIEEYGKEVVLEFNLQGITSRNCHVTWANYILEPVFHKMF